MCIRDRDYTTWLLLNVNLPLTFILSQIYFTSCFCYSDVVIDAWLTATALHWMVSQDLIVAETQTPPPIQTNCGSATV